MEKSYIPVSCDFIDQIEIFATQRKVVEIVFIEEGAQKIARSSIRTWFTKEKVEYLETVDGLIIRLDKVVSIEGITNEGSCAI